MSRSRRLNSARKVRSLTFSHTLLLLILAVVVDVSAQSVDAVALSNAFTNAAEACKKSIVSINIGVNKVTRKRFKHFEEHAKRIGEELDLDRLPIASVGSGVVIDNQGYILTNHHVVDNIDEDSILVTLHDGRRYYAHVVGSDPSSDLALIRIYANNLFAARFAKPSSVRLGELVLAIGSPLGLTFSVTSGVISAVNRDDLADDGYSVTRFIQTDAAINPGNSGGGLFRLQGDLVGINTAILSRSGYNVGYGLALSTDLVIAVYEDLRDDGRISRPSIGVAARSESFDSSLVYDRAKVEETVIVDRMKPGGAAERAGIKMGDIIRTLNGMIVRTKNNIIQYMAMFRPGQRITVGVGRNGDTVSVEVELDSMEVPFKQRDRLSKLRPHLGATVVATSDIPTLSRVERHGPCYHAGLQEGDRLVSIDGKLVRNSEDVSQITATLQPGATTRVVCERRGSQTSYDVVVGAVVVERNR
jgi:S1-C subfamily serine protease